MPAKPSIQQLVIEKSGALRIWIEERIGLRFRSQIASDDVLQEVWADLSRRYSSLWFDTAREFDSYIYSTAASKLADAIKAASRKRRGGPSAMALELQNSEADMADVLALLRHSPQTPSRDVSAVEAAEAVRLALASVSGERRSALEMRYIEGRSREEIAAALQKSDSAVNSLLYHGLRDLRRRLGSSARFFSDAPSDSAER